MATMPRPDGDGWDAVRESLHGPLSGEELFLDVATVALGREPGDDSAAIEAPYPEYRYQPVGFVREIIGVEPEWNQAHILTSLVGDANRAEPGNPLRAFLAWKACHGAGKTTVNSWVTIWWLLTRPLSRVQIVTPAMRRQGSEYLLPEVEKWVRDAPEDLPVDVQATKAVVHGLDDWKALVVQSREPEKVEGAHARDVLIIGDEAKGLQADIIRSLYGALMGGGGDAAFMLTSVPGTPVGAFYECWHSASDLWWSFTTTAWDSERISDQDIKDAESIYGGTDHPEYLRRVAAEFAADAEGAPWQREWLDDRRLPVKSTDPAAILHELEVRHGITVDRIVVGVDPSVSDDEGDECGIVVVGIGPCRCRAGGPKRHAIRLDDRTDQYTAAEWGEAVVQTYHDWGANLVVAERNQGGALVERNLRTVEGGEHIAYASVWAAQGKRTRAEPVSSLDQRGMIHGAGVLTALENEMCGWDAKKKPRSSPNRVDAYVHAVYELFDLSEPSMSEGDLGGGLTWGP